MPRRNRSKQPAVLAVAMLATACAGCGPKLYQLGFEPLVIRGTTPQQRKLIEKIEVSGRIQFGTDTADLLEPSFVVLDKVVAVLKAHPELRWVEIQGHTDASGQMGHNLELSQLRAEAVRDYLAAQGIAKSRLMAKGYGPQLPIADNETPQGRRANRRVEFVVLKRRPTTVNAGASDRAAAVVKDRANEPDGGHRNQKSTQDAQENDDDE